MRRPGSCSPVGLGTRSWWRQCLGRACGRWAWSRRSAASYSPPVATGPRI
jgi:hypothetical protein